MRFVSRIVLLFLLLILFLLLHSISSADISQNTFVSLTIPFTISAVSANPASTTVTITWKTNTPASSIVDYVLNNDFSHPQSTQELDTNPYVTTHTVTLSNVIPCVKYYFRVRSNSANGSSVASPGNSFMTSGCIANATILNQTNTYISATTGGIVSLEDAYNRGIIVSIPNGFSGSDANFQINQVNKIDVLNTISIPSSFHAIGSYLYEMRALSGVTSTMTSFAAPLTITMSYSSTDIAGINPALLTIERYDTSWTPLTNCSVNTTAQSVSCQTTGFSTFMLVSTLQNTSIVNPTSTGTTATGNNTTQMINTSSSAGPSCSVQPPGSPAPLLYTALPQTGNTVQLYFTDAQAPYDHYAVTYGTASDQYTYGMVNIGARGTRTITIGSLLPDTTYYFRVRAGNGCAAGPWSNELSIQTNPIVELNTLRVTSSQLTSGPIAQKKINKNNQVYELLVTVLTMQNLPVPKALLALDSPATTAITNDQGIARFTNVAAGDHMLMISYNQHTIQEHIYLTGKVKKYTLTLMLYLTLFPSSSQFIGIIAGFFAAIYSIFLILLHRKLFRARVHTSPASGVC